MLVSKFILLIMIKLFLLFVPPLTCAFIPFSLALSTQLISIEGRAEQMVAVVT